MIEELVPVTLGSPFDSKFVAGTGGTSAVAAACLALALTFARMAGDGATPRIWNIVGVF